MSELEPNKSLLLIKKLGAMLLLIVGCILTATGASKGVTGLTAVGILVLAVGVLLLIRKIVRRNQITS